MYFLHLVLDWRFHVWWYRLSFLWVNLVEKIMGKWSDIWWSKLHCLTCHFSMWMSFEQRERSMAVLVLLDGLFLVGVFVLINLRLDTDSIFTNSCDFFVDLWLPHNGWWMLKSPPIITLCEGNL